ncbi:cytochrome c [Mesonia aestuariivivens]|uniref:Cytochrome c n=1 Tax=Mesonia aestuariivivens TaxID=2796128 RepID=A0ABS6W0V6_9FLAO|nr:cytochrome c [Mesonia aestuariivivens]MBW2961462.1 cytochrome c [Mesonia aestuariivivens]
MNRSIYLLFVLVFFISCKKQEKSKQSKAEENAITVIKKTPLQESIAKGKSVYTNNCAQCHLPTGKGIPKIYPPLRKSNWLTKKRTESIHAVKYGLSGEITVNGQPYENVMTPMGLSDQEVADVLNYVMNMWGNKQEKMLTPEEVSNVDK